MSEMLERVRQAIVAECAHQTWDPEAMARAAIEAMREPTEAMVSAGAWNFGDLDVEFASLEASRWASECWRDMIDAAASNGEDSHG